MMALPVESIPMFAHAQLYDRASEDALIGSVMINPDLLPSLGIVVDDFHVIRNRWVWEAIAWLSANHHEIDLLSITNRLADQGRLADMGGQGYLLDILNNTPTSLHAATYAARVLDLSDRRRLVEAVTAAVQAAHDPAVQVEDTINTLATRLPDLVRAQSSAQHVSVFASRHYDRMDMSRDNPVSPLISTGFSEFDRITGGGLRAGELMLLAGKPGKGKTKFILQMANQMAAAGIPGVVFEMETSEDEIMDREFSRQTRIPTDRLEKGDLQDDEWPAYVQAVERMSNPAYTLFLDFTTGWSTTSLRAELLRMKTTYNLRWFMVDYMKFLRDSAGLKEVDRLNAISINLKRICRELDLAGIVIHHLNKDGLKTVKPDMDDMSQGADIAFDADKILFLTDHIPEEGRPQRENVVSFLFVKSRRKLSGNIFHQVALPDYPQFGEMARY